MEVVLGIVVENMQETRRQALSFDTLRSCFPCPNSFD